ncbi:MAG: ATP-binding cassette domain-containing protein, partial [Anaerolineae bacterium]|nr:ATP-binding cassette domain-containing protein [Anaerolineae bacterium]
MSQPYAIWVDGLSVRYGRQAALRDLSLAWKPGEFLFLTGPSGCGKSTLCRCLGGLIPQRHPSAHMTGTVLVDGLDTRTVPLPAVVRRVGLVFQNPATQLFQITVREEVAFGPRNLGLAPREVARRVAEAADALGIGHLLDRRLDTLSGGEKQRVAIAAILAMGPRTLVLDEPTASLDVPGARAVLEALASLHRRGTTVVLAGHRTDEVSRLAGRTVLLERGRVVRDGPSAQVLAERPVLRRLGVRRPTDAPPQDWPELIVPDGSPSGEAVARLEGVEVRLGGRPVLQDLDLTLHAGQVTALVGDNGSGKTTLARVLAGMLRPSRGRIWVAPARGTVPVGLLFQNPLEQLFCDTVGEEVAFGVENYRLPAPERVSAALAATGLDALRDRPTLCLSGGEQQRTALAALLALQPRLLILDEPTMGQDWGHMSRFMACVRALVREGMAVLLITHDYKLVHHYAERVLLL